MANLSEMVHAIQTLEDVSRSYLNSTCPVRFDMSAYMRASFQEHSEISLHVCISGAIAFYKGWVPVFNSSDDSREASFVCNPLDTSCSDPIHLSEFLRETLDISDDQAQWLEYGEFAIGSKKCGDELDQALKTITVDQAIRALKYLMANPGSQPSSELLVLDPEI